MLLEGVNRIEGLTNDTDRMHAVYRDVFDPMVSHDLTDPPGTPSSRYA